VTHAGLLQPVDQANFDGGGHHLFFVLQAVAGADVNQFDAGGEVVQCVHVCLENSGNMQRNQLVARGGAGQ
jgi:hypothetical protein